MSLRLLYLIFARLCGWLVLLNRLADLSRERIRRRPVLGGLINEYERAA